MMACQDQGAIIPGTATVKFDTNDGPLGPANPTRIASSNRGHVKSPRCLSSCRWTSTRSYRVSRGVN